MQLLVVMLLELSSLAVGSVSSSAPVQKFNPNAVRNLLTVCYGVDWVVYCLTVIITIMGTITRVTTIITMITIITGRTNIRKHRS